MRFKAKKRQNLAPVRSFKGSFNILQIKVNYDLTCEEMYQYILGNRKLLKQIQSDEKYDRNHLRSLTHKHFVISAINYNVFVKIVKNERFFCIFALFEKF